MIDDGQSRASSPDPRGLPGNYTWERIPTPVYEGLTSAEAAKVVGLSSGAARVRLYRSRRRPRGDLTCLPDDPPSRTVSGLATGSVLTAASNSTLSSN